MGEAVAQRCSVKKMFLKILQHSQESTCAIFFNKVAGKINNKDSRKLTTLLKKRIFKKNFFTEHLRRLLL